MVIFPKHLALGIAALLCLFRSQPRTIAEALVVGTENTKRSLPTSASAEIPNTHPLRRSFLATLLTCSGASGFSLIFPTASWAASEKPRSGEPADGVEACLPTDIMSQKLSDTRAQIDMAVQASSVQAFSSASEIANDALLDSSSLRALLSESCTKAGSSRESVIAEIVESVENMRSRLNGKTALTIEDVKDVMRYGTAARSAIDSIVAL